MTPEGLPDQPPPLTDAQRRRLAVFLEIVDRGLTEVLGASRPAATPGILASEADDLPPEFARSVATDAEAAREELRGLVERLDLAGTQRSRRKRLRALLVSMIVNLEDAGSRGLRGYGPMNGEISQAIDPVLQAIRERLVRIAGVLDQGSG